MKVFFRKRKHTGKWLSSTQMIVLGFGLLILAGALLLTLPLASRSGERTGFLTSLFTATSSTCVTGLVVVDTYQHWSWFGQGVILMLIQIGGLGFMSIAAIFSFVFRRQISLRERLLMRDALNIQKISGIVRLTKHALLGSLLAEAVGAVLLSVRFIKDFGIQGGITKGIFTAVSAFCNAGFDLMGQKEAFSSLTSYSGDIVVNVVVCTLIVAGGLGFFVWEDIFTKKSLKALEPYSKMVLLVTGLLIVVGAVLFALFEYGNPETWGTLDSRGKLLAPFFQSITLRTAGFNTVSQSGLTDPSQVMGVLWMFIGGSSGSTAGGVKTVTFAVLILTITQVSRGRRDIIMFKRRLSQDAVMRAMSVVGIGFFMVFLSTMAISIWENMNMFDVLYECVSAFATVGITVGLTTQMGLFSRIVLILLMFSGRVGIFTISMAMMMRLQRHYSPVQYPETTVFIG